MIFGYISSQDLIVIRVDTGIHPTACTIPHAGDMDIFPRWMILESTNSQARILLVHKLDSKYDGGGIWDWILKESRKRHHITVMNEIKKIKFGDKDDWEPEIEGTD